MRRLLAFFTVLALVFTVVVTDSTAVDANVSGAVGKIVFWSDRDHPSGELYVRAFSGGSWTRLTTNTASEGRSAWSPDGTRIAYVSNAAGTDDIWIMNADGGSKLNLTNDAASDGNPTWSPDGTTHRVRLRQVRDQRHLGYEGGWFGKDQRRVDGRQ